MTNYFEIPLGDEQESFDFDFGAEVDMVCPNCAMTSTFLEHEIGQFVVCDCCHENTILITKEEFERQVRAGEIHPDSFDEFSDYYERSVQ